MSALIFMLATDEPPPAKPKPPKKRPIIHLPRKKDEK